MSWNYDYNVPIELNDKKPLPSARERREQLEKDTRHFLSNGGRITHHSPEESLFNRSILPLNSKVAALTVDDKRPLTCKEARPCVRTGPGGETVRYKSMAEAHQRTGIAYRRIQKACSGLILQAGGYTWHYEEA